MFTGDLATKTFEFFKKEAGMTFKEFGDLKKSAVNYDSLSAVKAALTSLRGPQPTAPVAQAPVVQGPALQIPDDWSCTLGPLVLYRAVDLSPGKIKHKRRFSPRTNPVLALPKAIQDLLKDPRGYAEGHVRANYDYVHSAATDETCAGYQSQREYVYRINVPAMYKYVPPDAGSNVKQPPIIWADTQDRTLSDAKKIAFDPRKVTKEVDLIFDITTDLIEFYKRKGTTKWEKITWANVVAEP